MLGTLKDSPEVLKDLKPRVQELESKIRALYEMLRRQWDYAREELTLEPGARVIINLGASGSSAQSHLIEKVSVAKMAIQDEVLTLNCLGESHGSADSLLIKAVPDQMRPIKARVETGEQREFHVGPTITGLAGYKGQHSPTSHGAGPLGRLIVSQLSLRELTPFFEKHHLVVVPHSIRIEDEMCEYFICNAGNRKPEKVAYQSDRLTCVTVNPATSMVEGIDTEGTETAGLKADVVEGWADTICVWKGKARGTNYTGDQRLIMCMAVSPDQKRISMNLSLVHDQEYCLARTLSKSADIEEALGTDWRGIETLPLLIRASRRLLRRDLRKKFKPCPGI